MSQGFVRMQLLQMFLALISLIVAVQIHFPLENVIWLDGMLCLSYFVEVMIIKCPKHFILFLKCIVFKGTPSLSRDTKHLDSGSKLENYH